MPMQDIWLEDDQIEAVHRVYFEERAMMDELFLNVMKNGSIRMRAVLAKRLSEYADDLTAQSEKLRASTRPGVNA